MRTMYDAVTARNIIKKDQKPAMVAGYIDKIKLEPWSAADWALFPDARKVTIVKKASTRAGHVLDVEPGDATPTEAPGWAAQRRADGFAYPVIYCNRSTWPLVKAAFTAQKVAPPLYWIATASGRPEIPDGAIAAQYLLDVAPGIDVSAVADYWPGVDPAPSGNGGSAATTTGVELMERITITPTDKGSHNVRLYLPGGPNCRVVVRPRLGQKDAKSPVWIGHIFAWGEDGAGVGHDPATVPGYDNRLDNHRTFELPAALWCDLNYSSADPFEIDILG